MAGGARACRACARPPVGSARCALRPPAPQVHLRAPGDVVLQLKLPARIDSDSCAAKFSKKREELRLLMRLA